MADPPARLLRASSQALAAVVPGGLDGGRTPIRVDGLTGETAFVEVGAPLATGLHQVDNPAFDAEGNLYVTFSGARGQESPVSVFVVRPDGSREPFVSGLPNPTSLAFGPRRAALRVLPLRRQRSPVARDGTSDGVRDRSWRRVRHCLRAGRIALRRRSIRFDAPSRERSMCRCFASLPPSVAAFHLAFGPDGALYVTGADARAARSRLPGQPIRDGRDLLRRFRPAAGSRVRRGRQALRRRGARRCKRGVSLRAGERPAPEQVVVGGIAHRFGLRSTRRTGALIERHGLSPRRAAARRAR